MLETLDFVHVSNFYIVDLENSLHTDHARYVATGRTVALRACHAAQERGRRICALLTGVDKKLSYRRGTARCDVSIEMLPIATQQYRNYLYDKS